jgi:hypothetical protein
MDDPGDRALRQLEWQEFTLSGLVASLSLQRFLIWMIGQLQSDPGHRRLAG